MLVIRLAELAVVTLLVIFVVSQLIVPAVQGVQLFPWFRRRKLEATLVELREATEQQKLMDEIETMRKKFQQKQEASCEKRSPLP